MDATPEEATVVEAHEFLTELPRVKPWYKTGNERKLMAMIVLTIGYMLAELIVGFATGSLALVSDGFHMASDSIALVIAFAATRWAKKSQTPTYSYGWHRSEIIGSFVNGIFLFSVSLFIALEALQRFIKVEEVENPLLVVWVGLGGLALNLIGVAMFAGSGGHGHSHGGGGHGHSHGGGHGHEGKHEHEHKHKDSHKHKHGHDGEHKHKHGHKDEHAHSDEGHSHSHGDKKLSRSLPSTNLPNDSSSSVVSSSNEQSEDSHHADEHAHGTEKKKQKHKHKKQHSHHTVSIDGHDGHDGHESSDEYSEHVAKPVKVRDDNIHAVFLHVLGDLLGSLAAVASGLIIYFTPYDWKYYFDPALSIFIVLIILKSSVPLVRRCVTVLMQTVPTFVDVDKLQKALSSVPGVISLHDLHVWTLIGTKAISSVHVTCLSRSDFMTIAAEMKKIYHQHGVHATTIQPEFVDFKALKQKREVCQLYCDEEDCKPARCCPNKTEDALDDDTLRHLLEDFPSPTRRKVRSNQEDEW